MTSSSSSTDYEERYHKNPFPDYTALNSTNVISHTTNFIHDNLKVTLKNQVESLLNRLVTNKKEWVHREDSSIYTGSSGIAYMYYLLSYRFSDPSLMTRAAELLERSSGVSKSNNREITFLTGEAGRLALGAVIHHSLKNQSESLSMISELKSVLNCAVTHSYDELLYGRAGYLYAILFVNKYISPAPVEEELIKKLIDCILTSGKTYSTWRSHKTPLMYRWHDKEYLGGAHGLAGILYILLQAREFLTEQQLRHEIEPSIKYLQSLRFTSGNFPSSIGNNTDKLVHWCHGAPSMTMLFSLAYQVYDDVNYYDTAKDCGEIVWVRGLLKKGCGICHGVAGNAYSFLCLYQLTKNVKYLYRACKFAEWCFEYEKRRNRIPDRPYSLFEGLAGIIYFLADLIDPSDAKFPGYTL